MSHPKRFGYRPAKETTMSKAVNTNDPKYSKLTIGVCPDQ